jgi:hypothetical protein
MMPPVWQSLRCSGCKGYIDVRVNVGFAHEVEVACPNCARTHRRLNGIDPDAPGIAESPAAGSKRRQRELDQFLAPRRPRPSVASKP